MIYSLSKTYNCRLHPFAGWHEIGCSHKPWTEEDLHRAEAMRSQHLPPQEYFSYPDYIRNLEQEIAQEEACMESHYKRLLELKGKLPKPR